MDTNTFYDKYHLSHAIITSWNWTGESQLTLGVDLSNLYQEDYKESYPDFRPIVIVFDGCSVIDTEGKGFTGFTSGDARIIGSKAINNQCLELVFIHEVYDKGTPKDVISIIIKSSQITVTDSLKNIIK